jgi:hypothetical protein
MKKTQIVILLIIMQVVNLTYARANKRYLTEEQKMMYEKVIKPEWKERGEIYIPEELQRNVNIASERAGVVFSAQDYSILPLSEINGIPEYKVVRTINRHYDRFRLDERDYLVPNGINVEYNNQLYIMHDEFNKLMKAEGTKADSANVFQIAEKFVRLNVCGNIQIDSIEFINRQIPNYFKPTDDETYNVEIFTSCNLAYFPYKVQWNLEFNWETGEISEYHAVAMSKEGENYFERKYEKPILIQETDIKYRRNNFLKSYSEVEKK